jgi:hypothetical protein
MIVEPEARLAFWALAFLVRLHKTGEVPQSAATAYKALDEFDAATRVIQADEE